MKICKVKNYEEMSRMAANMLFSLITLKPDCVLGLATGSTPIGTYKNLIASYESGNLDFSQVKTVNLDEYKGLPRDNDQSYYYFMQDNLFQHVNIDQANVNLPDGMVADADAECARYDALVKSLGGADLQVLGLGRNGHIGFNEPDEVFSRGTHCVALTESTIEANRRFFADIKDVPREAITMGIQTIMSAKKILLLVSGADKAQALHDAIYGPITPSLPASVLQLHPDVTIIADEAALGE